MNRDWQALSLITQVGLTIAASIVLSLLLGLWIDGRFGTRPWATLVFALIGIAVGSLSVYRMVSAAIVAAGEQGAPRQGDRPRDGQKEDE